MQRSSTLLLVSGMSQNLARKILTNPSECRRNRRFHPSKAMSTDNVSRQDRRRKSNDLRGVEVALKQVHVGHTKASKGSKPRFASNYRQWHDTGFAKHSNYETKKRDVTFTMMSYNVLADYLVQTNLGLYEGNDPNHLMWEKRYPNLMAEIMSHQPDIVCLQEVQVDHYESNFKKDFEEHGFEGRFKQRTGGKLDGCATFFRRSKLLLEDSASIEFNQGSGPLDRDNVGLLLRLGSRLENGNSWTKKPVIGSRFVVANTHLLFNPNRHDVKLAQVALLLAEMDRLSTSQDGKVSLPCLLAGDFNLTPDSPVYSFLVQGDLKFAGLNSKNLQTFGHGSRLKNVLFPPELGVTDSCQHIEAVMQRHSTSTSTLPASFTCYGKNSLRHSESEPNFLSDQLKEAMTNSKHSGSGVLSHGLNLRSVLLPHSQSGTTIHDDQWVMKDYILYTTVYSERAKTCVEGDLKLLSRLRLASKHQNNEMGPIPNEICPSDHIPVVAKFLIKGRPANRK